MVKKEKTGWSGTALLIIAGIHTAFGILAGTRLMPDPQMQALVGDRAPLLELRPLLGVSAEPNLAMLNMFWFLFFGFALIPLGLLLRHLEQQGTPIPRFMAYALALLAVGGGIFLPASGFWTALIPAWSILRQNTAAPTSAKILKPQTQG